MQENNRCVYAHCIDGVVKYIGEGTKQRAYRKRSRQHMRWFNAFNGKDFDVVILMDNLSKAEARKYELEMINKYRSTVINKIEYSFDPVQIDYETVSKLVYYSEDSPTGLRWFSTKQKCKEGSVAGYHSKSGYADIMLNGVQLRAHRVVWVLVHGSLSSDHSIDHINGNKLDNRIENLRAVTQSQNNRNKVLDAGETGLRNIRFSNAKTGLSGFEVVWVVGSKRSQRTFNCHKIGSIEQSARDAYAFRDSLIEEGLLTPRIKQGEITIDKFVENISGMRKTNASLRLLPSSGFRRISLGYYKGNLCRFTVHYICRDRGVATSKSFGVSDFCSISDALRMALDFRKELIDSGILDPEITHNEIPFSEAVEILEGNRLVKNE